MTSGGKPDEPDAPLARGPPAGDLGAQRAERGWMRNVDRVAEHALLDAYLAEPPGYRLGLVRGVRGIPRRRKDDHVHTNMTLPRRPLRASRTSLSSTVVWVHV